VLFDNEPNPTNETTVNKRKKGGFVDFTELAAVAAAANCAIVRCGFLTTGCAASNLIS
jgi:hypothetical protein